MFINFILNLKIIGLLLNVNIHNLFDLYFYTTSNLIVLFFNYEIKLFNNFTMSLIKYAILTAGLIKVFSAATKKLIFRVFHRHQILKNDKV